MRYCMYLRKSRADIEAENKGEAETLARHEKALAELASKMNIPVEQIYREVVSGETISARPQVQRLLTEVEQGVWEGVFVMEIERLARGDTIDQGIVAQAFKTGGAKIITPLKVYDPDNEFDEEYFEFGLFMSRREYKTINRRIQRGRIASAKEGKAVISTPPYGYDKVKINGGKGFTLVPNESESKTVRLIYELYRQGTGMTAIAEKLDLLHIKPRRKDTWSRSTINDILKNPVYTGKIRWAYRKEKKIKDGNIIKKQRITNSDCIISDGLHPAIISQKDFDEVHRIRSANTAGLTKKDLSLKNPLSGIVFCKKCGMLMSRLGANKHTAYDILYCPNKNCDNVSAPLSIIENKITDALKYLLSGYEIKIIPSTEDSSSEIKKQILGELRQELKKCEKQIENTYDLVESGVYTKEEFIKRGKELAERRNLLYNTIINEETQLKNKNALTIQDYFPSQSGIFDNYEALSAEDKNKLLKCVLLKIEYHKLQPNRRGKENNDYFELSIYPKLI